MTTETKIRTKDVADDTSLRSLEITIGKSKIITPSKSLGPDLISSRVVFPNTGKQFNEIYKSFNPEMIEKIRSNEPFSLSKNTKFRKMREIIPDSPSISFIDYKVVDGGRLLPTDEEIDVLTNFAYTYSDITPIPAVPRFVQTMNKDNFDDFIIYLKKSIDTIEEWNHKPIMGYIPFVGMMFIDDIVDLYAGYGINAFYLDFNRKGLGDLTTITAIKRNMKRLDIEENHFIHFVNMDYGKVNKIANILPAKDFLGFGLGLDSMGDSHRPKAIPPKNGSSPEKVPPKKYRLFDREDYSYYRIDVANLENKETPYPVDAMFSRDEILNEKTKSNKERMIKLVNLPEQTKECNQLQLIASENTKNTFGYFEAKHSLNIKDLKGLKKNK